MTVPDDDRGLTLGDGLFETILANAGELVAFEAHVARLTRSCGELGLPAPDPAALRLAAEAALASGNLMGARAAVRLTWTAGSGGRGLDRPPSLTPRLLATTAAAPKPQGPASLVTADVRRNETSPTSRLKTLSYLDSVLARRQARGAGADEALMLNTRGDVASAAAANIFWQRAGVLFTPSLACGALAGIMRGELIEAASQQGQRVEQVEAGPSVLFEADAVFLTNSLIGVRSVSTLDGRALRQQPVQVTEVLARGRR